MNTSQVLHDLHVAFVALRTATFTDCPQCLEVVMTGNGSTWLTLTVETTGETTIADEQAQLVTFKITIDDDYPDQRHLIIDLSMIEIHDPDYLAAISYATRIANQAHNIIISNHQWKMA